MGEYLTTLDASDAADGFVMEPARGYQQQVKPVVRHRDGAPKTRCCARPRRYPHSNCSHRLSRVPDAGHRGLSL